MKRNNFKDMLKGKGFYIALMVGAICIVAAASVYMDSTKDSQEKFAQLDEQQNNNAEEFLTETEAETETEVETETKAETDVETETKTETEAETEAEIKTEPETEEKTPKKRKEKKQEKADNDLPENVAVSKTGKDVAGMAFDEEIGLRWPVKGEVIMNYSGETPVYFKTLSQYRVNQALLIGAEKGCSVCSAADAVVSDVGYDEEIGNYVETVIGDGYKLLYGQLDKVQVTKGDNLEEGQLIATLGSPTSYYSEEGCNLYLKMTDKDEAVDPMLYLR